jgi:hypothetical protein
MSPTARTLHLCRRSGYLCGVVESWIPHLNRRRDLFGGFDVFAAHPVRREVVLIQSTTADHLAGRLAKVKAVAQLPGLLAAGCKVQVHGWTQRGTRWRVEIVEIRPGDLGSVVLQALGRRRRRERQPELF